MMICGIFNDIFNTLVRNVDYDVRKIISFALFLCAMGCLYLSIRKKNDAKPLSLGWFILTFVLIALSGVYLFI